MPTMPPGPERVAALRVALRRAQTVGPFSVPVVAGLGAGFLASFVVDAALSRLVGTPARQLLDAVAFVAVAIPVWLAVQRRAVRDAHDVLTWLNGWETERWQREIGRRLHGPPRARPDIVDSLPDTMGLRALRVELLAAGGRTDEARDRLPLLPRDTAWQRFEAAALEEWISLIEDGPDRLGAMRGAAGEIQDEERRVVADTMVAAAAARRGAVSGGDAIGPLAAMRPRVGARPGRYAFSYRIGVIASVVLIGSIASAAVLVTAALLR